MENLEIKPCPYCGGPGNLVDINEVDKDACFVPYWVQCQNLCDDLPSTHEYDDKEQAIIAWNNRNFSKEEDDINE